MEECELDTEVFCASQEQVPLRHRCANTHWNPPYFDLLWNVGQLFLVPGHPGRQREQRVLVLRAAGGGGGGIKTDAQRGVERQREKNQRTGLTVHQRGRRPPPPVLRRLGCAAA